MNYRMPVRRIPGDLRRPYYDTMVFNTTLEEACSFHYCHTAEFHTTTRIIGDFTIVKVHLDSGLLLDYLNSNSMVQFARDYTSHMFPIVSSHYL